MVGQIIYPTAQITSTTASSTVTDKNPTPTASAAADAKKNAIAQLQAKLQAASNNPAAASRIAGEIDNAAKEYRAAGGTGPIPGVPAQVSRVLNQSAEDGSAISQQQAPDGSKLDIRV